MNTANTTYQNNQESSTKMLIAMVGIGIACALLIVLTFEYTGPTIEKNKAAALEKAIFQVLPNISQKMVFHISEANEIIPTDSETEKAQVVYAGYDDQNKLVGIAIEASGLGFADVIRILYGYDPKSQTIIGFHVLESKETPGLGDKIEKDPLFLENFKQLDVQLNSDLSAVKNKVVPVKKGQKQNPWEVDGITGATISSRAIGNILGESTQYWMPILFENQTSFNIDNIESENK